MVDAEHVPRGISEDTRLHLVVDVHGTVHALASDPLGAREAKASTSSTLAYTVVHLMPSCDAPRPPEMPWPAAVSTRP